jgi:alkylhydroperoxidase family enzyme
MVRWAKLLAEVRRPLDARRFELVTFAAAHELRNSSCSLAHGQKLSEFIGDEDVMRIAAGEAVDSVSEAEQEMVRFSRKVARDASTITAEDVEALKRHGLSDADVFDIAATVAARSFFTKLLDALGSVPDSSFASMNERLRDALTLARPIDTTPVEVMPAPE